MDGHFVPCLLLRRLQSARSELGTACERIRCTIYLMETRTRLASWPYKPVIYFQYEFSTASYYFIMGFEYWELLTCVDFKEVGSWVMVGHHARNTSVSFIYLKQCSKWTKIIQSYFFIRLHTMSLNKVSSHQCAAAAARPRAPHVTWCSLAS